MAGSSNQVQFRVTVNPVPTRKCLFVYNFLSFCLLSFIKIHFNTQKVSAEDDGVDFRVHFCCGARRVFSCVNVVEA